MVLQLCPALEDSVILGEVCSRTRGRGWFEVSSLITVGSSEGLNDLTNHIDVEQAVILPQHERLV